MSLSSSYTREERARIDAAARAKRQSPNLYQHDATLATLPPPAHVETWGDHMGINAGPIPTDRAIAAAASLGVKWIGCSPEFGWNPVVTFKTDLIRRITNAGLLAHICVQQAGHNYNFANGLAGVSALADDGASWVDAGARAITLLNEPNNLVDFWLPKPDPAMIGAALICGVTLERIRAKSATIPVYLPGMSPGGDALSPTNATRALMTALRSMGFNPAAFSGVGDHPYEFHAPLTFGLPKNPEWNPFAQIRPVYDVGAAAGIHGGMALGEYGCPSAGTEPDWPKATFTEAHQADVLREYFAGFASLRKSGVPIDYLGLSTAIDGDASTRPLEGSLGVFRKDGTEKPGAEVVRAQARLPYALAS